MPSSYTTSLRLVLPVTGELSGTWGDTVNNGLTQLVEAAVAGTATVAMSDANYTLTTANGATDEARQMVIKLTGALTATRNVTCPSVSKLYLVSNQTTGSQSIVFKTSAGSGVTVVNGARALLYCDGTDVVVADTAVLLGAVTKTSSTGSAVMPNGTTAQRDGSPNFGYTRANSSLTRMEWWNGSAWASMGGGATGGGSNAVFFENDTNVTTDYTITTGKNAVSAGPITVDSGITVTVPSGSVWTIV